MTAQVTKDIINATAGKFFTCQFVKKDGNVRRMVGRIGVHKYVTGRGLRYNPDDFNLAVVWDVQKREYRMVNLTTLQYLRCGDLVWSN